MGRGGQWEWPWASPKNCISEFAPAPACPPGQQRSCAGRCSRAAAVVHMVLPSPSPQSWCGLNAARGAALFVVSWAGGSFFTKNGQWMPGRKGLPLLKSSRGGIWTWAFRVSGVWAGAQNRQSPEGVPLSCSLNNYAVWWKEACKFFKPEKLGIWFVTLLTVLDQGELSYLRRP